MALSAVGLTILTMTVLASGGQYVSPCPAKSEEAKAARRALTEVSRQIHSLSPDEDTSAVAKRLWDLHEMRCFEGSMETWRPYSATRGEGLKRWWKDGGEEWLRSYLEQAAGSRTVVIPPDVRTSLTASPGTALSTVVCPRDQTCPESSAWKRRTQSAILATWKAEREWWNPPEKFAPPKRKDCVARLAGIPKEAQYTALRDCWERTRVRTPLLPIGEVRLPKEGWLILRGRRGHYSFCDEVRAYSLKTGSAYIASSCSALALVSGGHVDAHATDKGRKLEVTAGKVPVDALRDTTLLLMIHESVDKAVQPKAERFELPAGLEAKWRVDQGGSITGGVFGGSTAQTTIAWAFHPPGVAAGNGTFTWPYASRPAESLVAKWMAALEGRLEKGCPSERIPFELLRSIPSPDVNHRDAPDGVTGFQDALLTRLAESLPDCQRGSGG